MTNRSDLRAPDDDVALLVGLAAEQQDVPVDRAQRAHDAVRRDWLHALAHRRRRRRARAAAALVAAASLAAAVVLWNRSAEPDRVATTADDLRAEIQVVVGNAWSRDALGARSALLGDAVIRLGDEVATDRGAHVALRLPTGHSVRLDEASGMRWLSSEAVALDRGALYIDSGAAASAPPLTVHTPHGPVRELGTQFECRLDEGSLRVRVREGSVTLGGPDGGHVVRAGVEARLLADRSITTAQVAAHDAEWNWLLTVTPMVSLDGKTEREFLDWVARERGWKLQFADRESESRADEIVLGGTVRNLTIEQALDAVLPSCRMTHDVHDGVLRVALAP